MSQTKESRIQKEDAKLNPTGDKRTADFITELRMEGVTGKALESSVKVFITKHLPSTRQHDNGTHTNKYDSRILGAIASIGTVKFLNDSLKAEADSGPLHTICEMFRADGQNQKLSLSSVAGHFIGEIYHSDVNGGYLHGKSPIDDKSQYSELFPESNIYILQASGDGSFKDLYDKVKGLYHWFSPAALKNPDDTSKIDTAVAKGQALLKKVFNITNCISKR
jgi:hypothetical protein